MAALVTGISQMDPSNAFGWTNAAVAGNTAVPAPSGEQTGIDGNPCGFFQNEDFAPISVGTYYSLWSGSFATAGNGFDVSQVDQAAFLYLRHTGPAGFFAFAQNADSGRLLLFSGGGTANWAQFNHGMSGFNDGIWRQWKATGTPDATGGAWDATDVTGIGIAIECGDASEFGFQIAVDQAIHVDGAARFEDTGAAAALSIDDYFELMKADGGEVYHSFLFQRASFAFEAAISIEIATDSLNNPNAALGIGFKEADSLGFDAPALGYFNLTLEGQTGGSQSYGNFTSATNGVPYNLTIDATNGSISIPSYLAAGLNNVVIRGSGGTISGTVSAPATCSIQDADIDLNISGATSGIELDGDLVAGSRLTTDSDLNVNINGDDYSDIDFIFTASNTVTLTPTNTNAYNFSGMTTTGTVTFTNPTANVVTVTVPPSLSVVNATPATITLDNSVDTTLSLTNLQNPTEVRVYLTGSSTEVIGQENVTTGTFSGTIPSGTGNVDISILSLEYQNQYITSLSTASDQTIPVSQTLDRQYENP